MFDYDNSIVIIEVVSGYGINLVLFDDVIYEVMTCSNSVGLSRGVLEESLVDESDCEIVDELY